MTGEFISLSANLNSMTQLELRKWLKESDVNYELWNYVPSLNKVIIHGCSKLPDELPEGVKRTEGLSHYIAWHYSDTKKPVNGIHKVLLMISAYSISMLWTTFLFTPASWLIFRFAESQGEINWAEDEMIFNSVIFAFLFSIFHEAYLWISGMRRGRN